MLKSATFLRDTLGRIDSCGYRAYKDLQHVSQLVDPSQTRALAHAMVLLSQRFFDSNLTLRDAIESFFGHLETHGLDALDPFGAADLSNPGSEPDAPGS